MRCALKGPLENIVPECQFGGGCNTGATSVAHLLARAQVDLAIQGGVCVIQWFLDVKTAFAAMLRSLAIPYDAPDPIFFE
eukprot:2260668-Karenia_brevis.AAC.1